MLMRRKTLFSQSFILLIICCIGWMGIANASVQNMHWNMSMTMPSDTRMSSAMHHMSADCHQSDMPPMQMNDNCQQTHSSPHQQHLNCLDCQILHCQTINADLPQASLHLNEPPRHELEVRHYDAQTSVDLTGHWQEILRPPKA